MPMLLCGDRSSQKAIG